MNGWAAYTNAHGGVDGHPIKLYVEDDQQNATVAVSEVHQLIDQDHVVAIVGDQSDVDSAWASIPEQAGVPVIGGEPAYPPFVTNPDFFPQGGGAAAQAYGVVDATKQFGPKFAYLYCAEVAVCKSASTIAGAVAQTMGQSLVYAQGVSATAADYTGVCQALKNSGAQSVIAALASATLIAVDRACQQQGVTAELIAADGSVTTLVTQSPVTKNFIDIDFDFPFIDSSAPATQLFQSVVKQYAPNLGTQFGPNVAYQWVAAQLFVAAVQASHSSTVTAASVKQGLYNLPAGETLGGLAPPLHFTAGASKPPVMPCWFTWGLKNGQVYEPNGLKATCASESAVGALQTKYFGG
jgi:branched-chain amino acid transport system substrate-binding protein